MSPKKRIAVIPGDGIGPEVIAEAVKVIQASAADVELTHFDWSANRYLADAVTVPPDGFAMLERDFDAILLGADHYRRAMTVLRADVEAVIAAQPLEAAPDICLDRFDDVTQMQRPSSA